MSAQYTGVLYERGGQALVPKFANASIASATTDGAVITAVASRKLRILSATMSPAGTATAVTFNSKPAGAGSAKSATFTCAANSPHSLPYNPLGHFETVSGEGLTVTTGTGSATGIQVTYVEVP